jgi:golgi apyrase
LKNACFKATWIVNILHEGFGLPMEGTGNNYKHNLMLDVRNSQTFLDPFQSANTINGNELSWTLGRALLYSSSQIAPSSSNMHEVGFTPTQTGKEIPQFVVGGELLSSFPPLPTVDSSDNKLIFQLFVFAVLVLGICYYGLSNILSKSQRHFIRVSIKNRLHSYISGIAKKLERIRLLRRDHEYRQRLMEEDGLESMDPIRMKEFGRSSDSPAVTSGLNTPVLNASSFYNLRPFGSAITLGATTSMLDLKSIPSRVSSRLSMRPETVSSFSPYIGNGSASFSIDQEEPDESIRSTLQRSKSAFLKLYNF